MPEEPVKLDETQDAQPYEPPKRQRRNRRLLAWIGLVVLAFVLLAIFLFSGGTSISCPGKSPTAVLVSNLHAACVSYERMNGLYPWPQPYSVTATTEIKGSDVYVELRGLPGAKINTHHLDYLNVKDKRLEKNGAWVDQWGHEIMFRIDPETLEPVIWSCGPDGKDDTNDGVSPDPAKFPKTYYRFGTGKGSDDITNR